MNSNDGGSVSPTTSERSSCIISDSTNTESLALLPVKQSSSNSSDHSQPKSTLASRIPINFECIKCSDPKCEGQCGNWTEEQLGAMVYANLADFYATGFLCDAVLMTEDNVRFPVHSIVISGDSDYFHGLFTSPLRDPSETEFIIRGISSDMLRVLLDFIYTRTILISEDNVIQILESSDYLGILALRDVACQFIQTQLDPQNCIGIQNFAQSMFCGDLSESAQKYLMRNFAEVSEKSDELLDLPLDKTLEIFGHDRLNVKNEEIVWRAVLRWIDKDPEIRKRQMFHLIQQVRTGLMETQFFMENVKDHPYVHGNDACKPLVIDTLRFLYDLEVVHGKVALTGGSLTPNIARPRIPHEVLFAIGGWSGGSPTNIVETYDTRADRWVLLSHVDPIGPRAYHGTIAIGQDVIVVGGFDGSEYFNTCRAFNILKKAWRNLAPMHSRRCYVSVAVLDQRFIFAMGGYDGNHRQNTAEKYDYTLNQWYTIAPMNVQRSDASAAQLNGKIYVTGGFNGNECLSSVEVYDTSTNQWTFVTPMKNRRSGVSAVTYRGHVYVLGGFNGISRMASVEKYDPERNVWITVPDMYNQRSNFAVDVIDEMIFCIGGFNGATTIYHVECYDDRTNEWYEATDMNIFRSALSACVVTSVPNICDFIHQNRERLMEEKRQRVYAITQRPILPV